VHSRLERGPFAHLSLDGSEFLGDSSLKDYWAADLFVLIADNAPPDVQHVEQLLAGQIASIQCGTGSEWREFCP
jgi:hypothetical protein